MSMSGPEIIAIPELGSGFYTSIFVKPYSIDFKFFMAFYLVF